MKTDSPEQSLRAAPVPEPIGGLETARERMMGRVRHTYPVGTSLPRRILWRPIGATALASVVAITLFLVWPEPSAEADPLPTEAQMQKFYDQHEVHHAEHFHLLEVGQRP
ncbi:hypothetical protein [Armatimonas rosea]|uniref:Uncharacterized protein n=1 Tax=Armatimonas rosea TaxID=685828 RepID=A0A7W9SU50_ARMRO|nr:hypothetical protein [Armatimonas rosea]MBB6052871.1 hypothetical protein [Armatimonas rosea]